jgi:hypothetical protein
LCAQTFDAEREFALSAHGGRRPQHLATPGWRRQRTVTVDQNVENGISNPIELQTCWGTTA